ncbi:MAG: nodulation protein NfeD [Spirochaetaceae bacterium]|jgi:membrane-bound serine protease (ClpP class)|nr:nodulation protein NfeD [Spirochaetaceae bacterium]
MKYFFTPIRLFIAVLCACLELGLNAQETGVPARNQSEQAWLIPIRGDIDPAMTAFVRRETRKALAANGTVIVFEIDTFGGRVDSALQITSFILSIKNARTVAWVHNGDASMGVSWSAGALIAFSCRDIYMASGTSLGAAAPVTVSADGSAQAAGEKTVAAVRSQMAALAERNGHPVSIALAMVDFDVALWEVSVAGKPQAMTLPELETLETSETLEPVKRIKEISPKGKLLALTAGEACRYGLAEGIADEQDDLLSALGLAGAFTESVQGPADGFISFLTSGPVQALLILLGLVMLFLELNTPGFGATGTIAIICFLTVFGSGALLGKTGSLEILLFLLGIGLLAAEIFLIPGFGAAGIAGIVLIGFSLILSMQDFVIPQFEWEWSLLARNAFVVGAGIIAAVTGIAVLALFGPRIRLFDALTLKTRITGVADGSGPEGEADYAGLSGKPGTAATTLRPSGKAEIEGQAYSVETEGSFIEAGTPVTVVHVRGNRIIVRRTMPL